MKIVLEKDKILEDLKNRGLGQLDQRAKVEKEVDKVAKSTDVDDSSPEITYSNKFYSGGDGNVIYSNN